MDRNELEREVFGGSESELSSDEDEDLQPQLQQKEQPRAVKPPVGDYESSGGDSDDDYEQQRPVKPTKKKRLSKKGPEDAERRPVQRKRKRKQPVEVDLSELPPEQANKIRLDMRIEAILKPKKASRQRKKKANEEVLDSFADDEVARLRETMNTAADEDIRANSEKQPATAKLKLLPEAMETLRKAALAQSMIDNNLLEAVRRWLEPLPDRSLPALNIQRELFNIIRKMEFIDSAVLKESGLGRVVLFYTKCKRVTGDIGRIANELVSTWSRPIIKRSASYRDRVVPVAQEGGDVDMRAGERLNAILARAKEGEKGRVKQNAVMIPQRELGSYTVAPKMNGGIGRVNVSVDVDIERRRKNAERLRSLTRKTRRSTRVSPLAIVLPHPPLPHRRSSRLSANSAPQTPRSCGSPSIFFTSSNRKSTDSWNSSNADDMEYDWKPEQVLLLSRTLDALPAHLVTPFNGPIPPSNLLDKIARGVSQAKGPADWPHSLRATRVKIIELCRAKAREEEQQRKVIEEEVDDRSYYHDGEEKPLRDGPTGIQSRRPLYRQSSMDFIQVDAKENDNIAKLSNRLQRTDRVNLAYHPYSRAHSLHRRDSSPPLLSDLPSLINPSTPSSSTLTSLSSLSSHPLALRRTSSTLSSASISMLSNSSIGISLADPRVQRVLRSDSFCGLAPAPPPKDILPTSIGFKRVPSFGTLAQDAKREAESRRHVRKDSGSYLSSDEEEKIRTRQAKKPRTKAGSPALNDSPVMATPPASSPSDMSRASSPLMEKAPSPPAKDKTPVKSRSKFKGMVACLEGTPKNPKPKSAEKKDKAARPMPMNLQRNPSMFGAELPHLCNPSNTPAVTSPSLTHGNASKTQVSSPATAILTRSPDIPSSPSPPSTQKVKTLRRVRRLAPARRISFGSLVAPGDEADGEGEGEPEEKLALGSAFQLH